MNKNEKTVYLAFGTDIIHNGHVKIIQEASKLGNVTVGLLTDEAIATYKRLPLLSFEERREIVEGIKGVSGTIRQETLDYTENLLKLRPDYVVHGDDWREGVQKLTRERVLETLSSYGGELVEFPYTENVSSTALAADYKKIATTPDIRRSSLRRLLDAKPYVRAIDTSNGLTGLIAENTKIVDPNNGTVREFDAMWVSSLCDSTFKGKPDIELVDLSSRLNTINEIMDVTTKPIILDGDTGGQKEVFAFNVKTLERVGVSAVIIEDKTGLKQNSLFGTSAVQTLADPELFAQKIMAGKQSQVTRDFMIIARLESLIAGSTIEDALARAKVYIKAGADGIMIHSKNKEGTDIREFISRFRDYSSDIPVVVVPTTYNQYTEHELHSWGANIIIHANHLLRSAYPAMKETAESILQYGRSKEASEAYCSPLKTILNLIEGSKQ